MRILYIDIDSLRPDHLGCHGYHRETSPNIDRLAREGTRHEHCFVPDAPCLPSRSALMCGRFGIHTDAITGGVPFIMRGPGVEAGKLDTGLHSSLDLAARVTGRGEAADRLAAKHARDLA